LDQKMSSMESKVVDKEQAQKRAEADKLYQQRQKQEESKKQSNDMFSNLTSYKVE
jgi:hypothetical protein